MSDDENTLAGRGRIIADLRSRLAAAEAQAESFLTAATEYPATVIEVGTEMVRLTDSIRALTDEWHRMSVHEGKTLLVTSHAGERLRALLGDTSTPTEPEADKLR